MTEKVFVENFQEVLISDWDSSLAVVAEETQEESQIRTYRVLENYLLTISSALDTSIFQSVTLSKDNDSVVEIDREIVQYIFINMIDVLNDDISIGDINTITNVILPADRDDIETEFAYRSYKYHATWNEKEFLITIVTNK